MKITGSGRTETTPVKRKNVSGAGSGSEFVLEESTDGGKSSQTNAPLATGRLSSLGALIGLQETCDKAHEGRRKAFERAEEMLDLLDDVRHGLLLGELSSSKLNRLLSITKVKDDDFADPGLVQILSDIKTRAKVELAKIEMSRSSA